MGASEIASPLPNGSPEPKRRRRTPGEGGLRERSPGHWEIKFDAGRDPQTGRRVTRFIAVRGNKKKALEELAKYRNQAGEGTLLEPAKKTVALYLEEWLVAVESRVSRKTHERYAEIVRKHLAPAIGAHALAKLAPVHLQGYYAHALRTPRKRTKRNGVVDELAPLSAHTVKHHHRVLSQALKAAVRLRYLARNPADDVDPPRPVHREMQIIDQAQTAALLKAAEGSPVFVPVLLGATCGMRRGEILALRWKDLSLEARTLSVVQTLEEIELPDASEGALRSMHARGLAFKAPKTERSRRTITLPALTADALARHRARQAEDRLRAGKAYAAHDLVCCDPLGEPLSPHHVSQVFAKLARRLRLRIRFHDLRHTHMSHLLAAGVHPKVASERAGHASVSITLDVYSHLIPGMQEDAANRIDAALRVHLDGGR